MGALRCFNGGMGFNHSGRKYYLSVGARPEAVSRRFIISKLHVYVTRAAGGVRRYTSSSTKRVSFWFNTSQNSQYVISVSIVVNCSIFVGLFLNGAVEL